MFDVKDREKFTNGCNNRTPRASLIKSQGWWDAFAGIECWGLIWGLIGD